MLSLISRRARASSTCGASAEGPLRPNRDVFSAAQDEITVLLDLRRQTYLGIDEVGSLIWRAIERGATRREIEAELASEYDISPDVIEQDTARFLADLLDRGLVVRA